MATVHLHMQNLPPEASAADILRFFSTLDIPDGGVQIVGGSKGDAFVTFANNEDLLNATEYNKSDLMGRQILLNLVNGEEIERIIDNMKHELVSQISPLEMPYSQQPSQSREPPASWGMAAPQVYPRPTEYTSASSDHRWQERQLDPVPAWNAGREPKRMRLSSQEPDRRWYNSPSMSSADSSENLQTELEMERRRFQKNRDELNRNKERIERLTQVPRMNPVVRGVQTSQVAGQRAEWFGQQSHLRAKQSRYSGPTSYYGDQRFSGQNEGYNQGRARFPGPSHQFPEKIMTAGQRKRQRRAAKVTGVSAGPTEGSPGPSRNNKDQLPPSVNAEHPNKFVSNNQRKKQNKARRLLEEKAKTCAGYVKLSNVDHTVTATEVREFFEGYQISPGGLKMKKNVDQDTLTVYIQFVQLKDAQNCYKENKRQLSGREVTIEAISRSDFDAQEGTDKFTHKPATFTGPKKIKTSGGQKVRRVSSPYSGSIKQAVYFISLKSVPEDSTASGIWDEFGGASGRSVGVLLLDKKEPKPGKEAYVAYENYYYRNSEIPLHEGANDWIDRAIYARFSDFSSKSTMYKTTPTGEDVELSDDEKALLTQKFLLKSSRIKPTHMTEQERESEQPLLNEISRSLFDITSTEVIQQVNIPETPSESYASRPCYLRLDCLPPDMPACDVWDWFGAASGPCLHATVTRFYGKGAPKTRVAYVAFRDRNSCNKETYKYAQSKILTEQEASDDMAKAGTTVLESTNEVVKRAEAVSSPYSGSIKQGLYFTSVRNLPEDATASSVWKKFEGSTGCSVGVLFLDKKAVEAPSEAYVAYENYYDRNNELPRHKGAIDWMDKAVYIRFADAATESKMYKTTPTGEDVELSNEEKALLKQKFLLRSSRTPSTNMSEQERESEQPFLNEISRSLFDITSTEVNQQVNIPDSSETCASGACCLRLDCLPPDIPAREIWKWFGAASGPCVRVTLTRVYGKEALKTKLAYVAFKDPKSCNAEAYKYDQSKVMTIKEVFDEIADNGIRVIESTEELVTKEEKQVDLKAEASIHILRIKDIGSKLSSSKLWTGWFGGKKGAAQAVTVMNDGKTRTAFVAFRDLVTCKAEKEKNMFSEVISETEMLKQIAYCPSNGPPDQSVTSSNAIGDRIMPKRERAELRARFGSANANYEDQVQTSEHTSVTSKDIQTASKVKGDSKITEYKQAIASDEKEGKKSDDTSTRNAASTALKPEENVNRRVTAEKGTNPGTLSKPEENTDMENVTEPRSIANTELIPCIGGTQTKFFLQIPGITRKITSSKVWSLFGGPEGSVLRVTVVPKVGKLLGQAFVEFPDAASCDAALSHYQRSKVLTEQDVLRVIASHACRNSKDIFQSSVLGIDRAMTVEERELIIDVVYPDGIPEDKEEDEEGSESEDPETKFFLRIPNLDEHITACKVWTWFGGADGPLPGVTLVHQAAGMKKDAYVAFSDAAARNAVKFQYSDSTDLDEHTMQCTLAEACKSNAKISQSSVTGEDRLLTAIERELITKQVFPNSIQSDTSSPKAYPDGEGSSGTGLPRQATEDVPMLSDEEEAQNIDVPRLLQKPNYEYIHLTELKPEITAFMLSLQYRPCCGVTLIKNAHGQSVAAYIAFEPKTNPKAKVWQKTRDRELADLDLDYEIYEDTGRLGDRLITLLERQQFLQYVKKCKQNYYPVLAQQ